MLKEKLEYKNNGVLFSTNIYFPENSSGTLVYLFHGLGSNKDPDKEDDVIHIMRNEFTAKGCTVVTPTMRGHYDDDTIGTYRGILEPREVFSDNLALMGLVEDEYGSFNKNVFCGHSLGAWFSLYLGHRLSDEYKVNAILSLNGLASLQYNAFRLHSKILSYIFIITKTFPMGGSLSFQSAKTILKSTEKRVDFYYGQKEGYVNLRELKCPLLLYHNSRDSMINRALWLFSRKEIYDYKHIIREEGPIKIFEIERGSLADKLIIDSYAPSFISGHDTPLLSSAKFLALETKKTIRNL